jgi:hypothetical protein
MNKFEASDCNVGVCSVARYIAGYLNQEIITLLECNGVPKDIFMKLQVCQTRCMQPDLMSRKWLGPSSA